MYVTMSVRNISIVKRAVAISKMFKTMVDQQIIVLLPNFDFMDIFNASFEI